ncbi:HAD family hydrolase [Poriferisphaera sp. WC338]|uniref:HAD family hydrolase n=1 Tax=Poriferisphaera sp. WC338 TaxID=3425129 RepID=UPI003D815438
MNHSPTTPIALFIDIDGTLINELPYTDIKPDQHVFQHRLLAVIRDFAIETKKLSHSQAEAIIHQTFESKTWWDWSDYLNALDLDHDAFWACALKAESEYLHPIDSLIPTYLSTLKDLGYQLFITSNNPISGIRHKLRIAGIGDKQQLSLFTHLLGTNNVAAMKWSPAFWTQAINLVNIQSQNIITIGDTWQDDIITPQHAAIKHHIFINTRQEPIGTVDPQINFTLTHDWPQIVQYLTQLAETRLISTQHIEQP